MKSRSPNQVMVTLAMDQELVSAIDQGRGHMSKSAFIREAVAEELKRRRIEIRPEMIAAPDRAGKGGRPRATPPDKDLTTRGRSNYLAPERRKSDAMLNEDAPSLPSGQGLVVKPVEMPTVEGVSPHVAGMAAVGQKIADGIVAEKRKDREARRAASPSGSKGGPAR